MNGILFAFIGTLFTFSMTALGAAGIFFLKNEINPRLQCAFLGFAGGVMAAASIWSLLIPAIDYAEKNKQIVWLIIPIGFILGVITLLIADRFVMNFYHRKQKEQLPIKKSTFMLVAAITAHNIPEGMSVGLAFALAAQNDDAPTLFMSAVALAVGIAIQNFPEGTAVALPLVKSGMNKRTAFFIASMTAVVEPIFGVLAAIFASFIQSTISLFLAFAAGTMIYVVVEELIPEAHTNNQGKMGTLGFMVGFLIMMILDISFS